MIVRLKNGVPCPYNTLENGKIYEVVRTAESTRNGKTYYMTMANGMETGWHDSELFDHLDQIREDKLKEIGI